MIRLIFVVLTAFAMVAPVAQASFRTFGHKGACEEALQEMRALTLRAAVDRKAFVAGAMAALADADTSSYKLKELTEAIMAYVRPRPIDTMGARDTNARMFLPLGRALDLLTHVVAHRNVANGSLQIIALRFDRLSGVIPDSHRIPTTRNWSAPLTALLTQTLDRAIVVGGRELQSTLYHMPQAISKSHGLVRNPFQLLLKVISASEMESMAQGGIAMAMSSLNYAGALTPEENGKLFDAVVSASHRQRIELFGMFADVTVARLKVQAQGEDRFLIAFMDAAERYGVPEPHLSATYGLVSIRGVLQALGERSLKGTPVLNTVDVLRAVTQSYSFHGDLTGGLQSGRTPRGEAAEEILKERRSMVEHFEKTVVMLEQRGHLTAAEAIELRAAVAPAAVP